MSTNPRRGKPSASILERLRHCSPSHSLCEALKEQPDYTPPPENEDAASGTKIHAVLAGQMGNGALSASEQETCDICTAQEERILEEWAEDDTWTSYREQRLGLTALGVFDVTDDSKAEFLFTGQADVVYIQGNRALCIDYKTGRGEQLTAVDNAQLAGLAVLVAKRYRVDSVRVAIIQPWAGKPTKADYIADTIEVAYRWLLDILHEAERALPDQAKAGPWCKYCAFGESGRCWAFNEAAHRELETIEPINIAGLDPKTQREAMFARAMELPPQRHVAAYQGLAIIKRYVDAIEGSFKTRVEAGQVPGWEMQNKPGNREITDAQLAFNALAPLGVTTEDALAACSMSIGPLEEAVRRRSGIKSQTAKRTLYKLTMEEAEQKLNDALEKAGAMKRQADKKVPVMVGNQIEDV